MWELDEAMEAVQALQPETREFGFHLALGGGVLNNGVSNKDLDLYFLPLSENKPNDIDGLIERLMEYFGEPEPIGDATEYPDYKLIYRRKVKFHFDNRRIDAFII